MAKHNLFLGSAVASVGDVTLMRKSGKQVSRVRVRTINNPKTYGQAFQRAAMANITKFYAPLAIVLEKSWEGQSKAASYAAFIKKNVEIARKNSYLAKKGTDFMPMPYYISMGTLSPIMAEVEVNEGGIWLDDNTWSVNTLGNFSQYLITRAPSAKNGDQITLLAFCKNEDGYTPVWCRFYLDTTSTAVIDTVLTGFSAHNTAAEGETARFMFKVNNPADGVVAAAMILSHWENGKWRRSPEVLDCAPEIFNLFQDDAYIQECIGSFRTSADANPSEVYLNGTDDTAGMLSTTAAGASADLISVGKVKHGFIDNPATFIVYVEDTNTGKKYAFKNDYRNGADYMKIAAANRPVFATLDQNEWGTLPYSNSAAEGDEGAKRNYDFLIANNVPAKELGVVA